MGEGEPALVVDHVHDEDVELGRPELPEQRLVPEDGVAVRVDHRPRLEAEVPEHPHLKVNSIVM